jgi:hypothetical protein
MSKTFAEMKTNVGNMVQETGSDMSTLIGVWLNDKYQDVSRRMPWSALIDFDYSFSSATGTATYNLPTTRFDREIYLADITDGAPLTRMTEGNYWEERTDAYSAGILTDSVPDVYLILRQEGKLRLFPTPAGTAVPVILDIEYALELGAIAEAWAYLGRFQKADYFMQRYEVEVSKRIAQERTQFNQYHQMMLKGYRICGVERMTGDTSYADL